MYPWALSVTIYESINSTADLHCLRPRECRLIFSLHPCKRTYAIVLIPYRCLIPALIFCKLSSNSFIFIVATYLNEPHKRIDYVVDYKAADLFPPPARVVDPAPAFQYLENDDYSWTVTVHTIPKVTISAAAVPDTRDAESVHYLYVCKKGGTAEEGA